MSWESRFAARISKAKGSIKQLDPIHIATAANIPHSGGSKQTVEGG
jgi:hypothetical protein